jgi:outer membrane lipoprotein-sorting protein
VRLASVLVLLAGMMVTAAAAVFAADDAPAGVDEKLWKLMLEVDARGASVRDLTADFTQEKHTPLLKKPLVSTGTIRIKGSAALWHTAHPEPTVMRIDDKEVKLLYPKQKVLEIFATDDKMGSLAASPFPRLAVIRKHFTFERVPANELMGAATDESKQLALRMRPIDESLKKHIDEVCVVLDIGTGLVLRAQTIDGDGDRIVLTFSNTKVNTGLTDADLALDVPPGVTVTRPLEGGKEK